MTLRSILAVCCTPLLLVVLLAPTKTHGNQGHQGLSDACHVASLFVGGALLHGGLRLYNLSGQVAAGVTMVAGYQGANVMDVPILFFRLVIIAVYSKYAQILL